MDLLGATLQSHRSYEFTESRHTASFMLEAFNGDESLGVDTIDTLAGEYGELRISSSLFNINKIVLTETGGDNTFVFDDISFLPEGSFGLQPSSPFARQASFQLPPILFDVPADYPLVLENTVRADVAVLEPLTILGAGTAAGFGAFFKREINKKKKGQKDSEES